MRKDLVGIVPKLVFLLVVSSRLWRTPALKMVYTPGGNSEAVDNT